MVARPYILLLAVLTLIAPKTLSAQQKRDLADVLRRTGSYVEAFQRELSSIVAEETYLQEVLPLIRMGTTNGVQRRRLRSDLLLVRPEDAVTWVQFRDVFEIDCQPVRDREERLARLFLRTDRAAGEQVRQVQAESARYNIGDIMRTMNVPVLPLSVLAPSSQHRFRFTADETGSNRHPRIGNDALTSPPTFSVTAEIWIVRFEERKGPTLVRTTEGRDIFSRGRFWIEPESGRVLISEMITGNEHVRGELVVSYQSEPVLGLLVPIELRERYSEGRRRPTILGTATYSNFRRFKVLIDETIAPIR